jgi:ATP-dependent protease ClpP protease subunit
MKPLLKLLADNRKRGQFRAETSGDEATLYLYDAIVADAAEAEWFGGVDPLTFAKVLAGITAPIIHLRINSPGGDVFAAQAIAQALREHPAQVIAHVDGYAASAATEVAVAADEVVMAPGAMYMIHNAWTIAWGNKNDLMDTAALLEKVDGTLAEGYAGRTGQAIEQVRAWMDAETWFTAQEAVDAGFADRIAEAKPKAAAKWDLSAYAHAPATQGEIADELDDMPADPVPPAPTFNGIHQHRENSMKLALVART